MFANVQIKKVTRAGANSKSSHILREGEKYKDWIGKERNIVLKKAPIGTFTKAQKPSPTKDEKKSEADRRKELKNINANISTYQKRISKLDEELDRERILKMQKKLDEYYKKRDELKSNKQVEETRGRNKKIEYIEFVFGLTDTPTLDDELNQRFTEELNKFLQKDFFKKLETTTSSVHLDQSFLHAHILVKLPENTTWDKYIKKHYKDDGRKLYKDLSISWARHCKRNGLEELIGEEIEEHTLGGKKDYSKYLNKFKENEDTEAFKERLKALQGKQIERVKARESRKSLSKIAEQAEAINKSSRFTSSKAESNRDDLSQSTQTDLSSTSDAQIYKSKKQK